MCFDFASKCSFCEKFKQNWNHFYSVSSSEKYWGISYSKENRLNIHNSDKWVRDIKHSKDGKIGGQDVIDNKR